jgi:hypothetical protein
LEDESVNKAVRIFALLAFVTISIYAMDGFRRFAESGSGDIFGTQKAEGEKIMMHFDQNIPLTTENAMVAQSKARQAFEIFYSISHLGDVRWEMEDARAKIELWAEIERNLAEQINDDIVKPYEKANRSLTKIADKIRQRK